MRHILIFLLLSAACHGQGAHVSHYRMFGNATSPDAQRTFAVDAATDYYIPRWQQLTAKTLNKVVLRTSAVNGTLGGSDLVAELLQNVSAAGSLVNTVTYTDASDVVSFTGHPFSNGSKVRFGAATSLPAGIAANTTYYVCNSAANTFQIDDDSGCASLVTDFSGSSGTQAVRWFLEESSTVTTTPTGAENVEFTGFTTALTAGTFYAIAVRNANGTPGTNYPTFATNGPAALTAIGFPIIVSSTSSFTSTSNVATQGAMNVRLEFSDGSFLGGATAGGVATESVYGTAAAGVRVGTAPAALKAAGVCMYLSASGTPTSDYEYRIYTGNDASESLLGTTGAINRRLAGSPCALFSSPVTIPSGAIYRIIVAPISSGDSSSNRANVSYYPIPDTAADKALYGGIKKATCTVPCSAGGWTYTDTHIPLLYALILKDGDELSTASSGGGSHAFVQ